MMSLLGKYRREEKGKDEEVESSAPETKPTRSRVTRKPAAHVAVPNKERKSPIMSFSVTSDLRACLQAVRVEKAINLSMWVERKLREAVMREFPDIADAHLRS